MQLSETFNFRGGMPEAPRSLREAVDFETIHVVSELIQALRDQSLVKDTDIQSPSSDEVLNRSFDLRGFVDELITVLLSKNAICITDIPIAARSLRLVPVNSDKFLDNIIQQ